jgi:hypothetical protein
MRYAMYPGLWIRVDDDEATASPFQSIQLRGPQDQVEAYIADHWGADEVESLREFGAFAQPATIGPVSGVDLGAVERLEAFAREAREGD